jgi:hypothetical protein
METTNALSWRISPVLPVAKLVGAVAILSLVYAFGRYDPVQWVLAGVTTLFLLGWAIRDLVLPVRLTADPAGLTVVSGIARRRHLPWGHVERIRVDRRERRGLRSELLEIDAGETLHFFGPHELGAAPEDVAVALESLRATAGH